ncbi:hypothetical protein NE865_11291 [Phthorimaea operculella]|nr:hypothetical protein NE865_11291 [Phthorimaea operculella]
MQWSVVLYLVTTLVVTSAVTSPRRCAGRLAKERLKAAEKIRDKRYYFLCCTHPCTPVLRRPRPPMTTRRYQPYHKLWYGLKHDVLPVRCVCAGYLAGRAEGIDPH